MNNIRKNDAGKPVEPVAPPSQTMTIYDRYPSPRPAADQASVPSDDLSDTPAPRPGPDDGPTDFVIGRGTRLKGKIEAGGDVIVEGKVDASIRASTMRIAAGGSVNGEVDVANTKVRGLFQGTLNVRECLTISGDGHVSGTVRYGEFKVDRGARITGDIALVGDAPQQPSLNLAHPARKGQQAS